jgi:hypothetical protein
MPIDVLVSGTAWDTTFVINDDLLSQSFTASLSHEPNDVRLDPDNWIVADKLNLNDSHYPRAFRLYQNFPNPFNPGTMFSFDLPVRATVTLTVYNLLGEEIVTLQAGRMEAGHHEIPWDGRMRNGKSAPAGVYFCVLVSPAQRSTIKLLLVR